MSIGRSILATHRLGAICLGLLVLAFAGCSIKQVAVKSLGDALSGSGSVYASDEDPELIKEALPFSLKLMESVLAETPKHEGLLLSLCRSFTQYAYGFAQLEADLVEEDDYESSVALRDRAKKLYLRARSYGLRGLEAKYPGFGDLLKSDAAQALQKLSADDVPVLYWTGAAWASAVALSLDDPELVGDLGYVGAMMERALELDEAFDNGAIHSFFITYEMSRLDSEGDPTAKAARHYQRALELCDGQLASTYLAYAEAVAVERQDKELFLSLVNQALAVDVDARPALRLGNILYQRRAKWLLTRLDWLFL